jgi:hypothetical protein
VHKGYVKSIVAVQVGDNWREDFTFNSNPENAWYWTTFSEADVKCMELNKRGVEIPSSEGGAYLLRNFNVEETAPCQFSIYCEGPFIVK